MKKTLQIDGIISIVIGLILLFIPSNFIINTLQFILGFILILLYLPITLIQLKLNNSYAIVKSLVLTILGFVIIFLGFDKIASVVGIIWLVFLIIDLINSKNKLETFKKDLIKYIVVLVLIVVGISKVFDIIIRIIGAIMIIVGIVSLFLENKNTSKPNNNKVIGGEVIDAEFEKHED